MLILPAIDIRGGQCVRLVQGDYNRETVFGDDPARMAERWVAEGATYLHLVDLDGAREGRPINADSVRRIVEATGVACQLGGGLRSEEHIADCLALGVSRVILGTRALKDPAWCERMCQRFPGQIVLGLDAQKGKVATQGWLETGELTSMDVVSRCIDWPLAAVVYTDIGRDGMLQGPDVMVTRILAEMLPVPVIASGGIGSLKDIAAVHAAGLTGCIVGRALYEGRVDLATALKLYGNHPT